jgi:hypothetical protein
LRRERIVHDLAEAEKHCVGPAADRRRDSELYEYIPASMKVIQDVCLKYEGYKASLSQTHDQMYQAFSANIHRYFPNAWKPEYEQYVRFLYAPTLSGDWPRLAMVRAIYQQITYLHPVVHDWAYIKARTLVLGGEAGRRKLCRASQTYR